MNGFTRRRVTSPQIMRISALGATVAALAACAPITTQEAYDPSDGVSVSLTPEVRGINLLIASDGEGSPGTVVGALSNSGDQDAIVLFAPQGAEPIEVQIPARETVLLGAVDGVETEFDAIDAPPGAFLGLTFMTADGDTQTIKAPVMDGTLEEYRAYIP